VHYQLAGIRHSNEGKHSYQPQSISTCLLLFIQQRVYNYFYQRLSRAAAISFLLWKITVFAYRAENDTKIEFKATFSEIAVVFTFNLAHSVPFIFLLPTREKEKQFNLHPTHKG
jgi:hypothetical protein